MKNIEMTFCILRCDPWTSSTTTVERNNVQRLFAL